MYNQPIEIIKKERGTIMTVKINAGIKFTLLSTQFAGAVQKDENKLEILLIPSAPEFKKEITIKQMIDQIKGIIVPELKEGEEAPEEIGKLQTQIGSAVTEFGDKNATFNPLEIGITIEEAFIYYRKEKDKPAVFEYAFSLLLNMAHLIREMEVFSLDSISMSVWNTERPGIIKEMKMLNIDDYLRLYDQPQIMG